MWLAARKQKSLPRGPWRFYVYEIFDDVGVQYVGKGSGKRLVSQRSNFQMNGREVARFHTEADAYSFEITHIAAIAPPLNKHAGGNGSLVTPKRKPQISREYREIARLGTRVYTARMLLRFYPMALAAHGVDASRLEEIRQVADGPRC